MDTVPVTTADGFSLCSTHTVKNFGEDDPTYSNLTAEELAERVANGMKRDHGRQWLWYMGVDPEEIKKYTNEDFMRISDEVASWPRKESETCSECGQELPPTP